ncbi:MAG TPA: AAA family ATPase [Pyrinomonadaceae bacterium]|nr:AAA family ATPase [Pyrinomonadaceae bacterium]HMP66662.1 AAA family ATPase [Pyrinomonadaceae bacterium]
MNSVHSIAIEDFWGNHSLSITFHEDVNFLIGINGSGKTTVINLIAAVLTADFETLDRYEFRSIEIKLKSGKTRPRVEVVKNKGKQLFPDIEYRIFDTAGTSAAVYSLSDLEEQYAIRGLRNMPRSLYEQRVRQLTHSKGLLQHLRQLVNVRWLSVNRAELSRTIKEEHGVESTVDQKLMHLTQQLAIFFGSLSGEAEKEVKKFQKTFFVSIVPPKDERKTLWDGKTYDLAKENAALQEIYNRFQVDVSEYKDHLDEYFNATKASIAKIRNNNEFAIEDVANILYIRRIHDLVQKWEVSTRELERIYAPRDRFLEILNELLQRKKILLGKQNELLVKTESGKEFPVTLLSSGEKQLLIILGEALLQTDNVWVYIADEPELSLHVRWQELLISSIRRVNKNAQIVVATHSPDIVSIFDNKVFDMEDVLK